MSTGRQQPMLLRKADNYWPFYMTSHPTGGFTKRSARGSLLASKITSDHHILPRLNTECPEDTIQN